MISNSCSHSKINSNIYFECNKCYKLYQVNLYTIKMNHYIDKNIDYIFCRHCNTKQVSVIIV